MKDLCINLYADRKVDSAEKLTEFLYSSLDSEYIVNPRETKFMNQWFTVFKILFIYHQDINDDEDINIGFGSIEFNRTGWTIEEV